MPTADFMGAYFDQAFSSSLPNAAFAFEKAGNVHEIVAALKPAVVGGKPAYALTQSPEQATGILSLDSLVGESFDLCLAFIDASAWSFCTGGWKSTMPTTAAINVGPLAHSLAHARNMNTHTAPTPGPAYTTHAYAGRKTDKQLSQRSRLGHRNWQLWRAAYFRRFHAPRLGLQESECVAEQ